MYCPKCGTEYRTGYTICADCNVNLVEDKPQTLQKDNDEKKLKNHKFGLISFFLGFAVLAWIVISDVLLLTTFNRSDEQFALIQMNIIMAINIIGLILGIVSLFKKKYKKTLAVWGIVFNSLMPLSALMGILSAIAMLLSK